MSKTDPYGETYEKLNQVLANSDLDIGSCIGVLEILKASMIKDLIDEVEESEMAWNKFQSKKEKKNP